MVNMAPDMVPPSVKSSRRWRLPNTLNILAPSAERTRKSLVRVFLSKFNVRLIVVFRVKRQSTGIWKCIRCKKTMAGGAYILCTSAAITARTTVSRMRKTVKGATD